MHGRASIRAVGLGVATALLTPAIGWAGPPASEDDSSEVAERVDAPPEAVGAEDRARDGRAPPADVGEEVGGFVAPADDAPPAERAKTWFLRGVELYRAGRYTEAARAYESSADAVPRPSTVYNAALSHDRAGHKLLALEAFEAYLDMLEPEALADPIVAEGAEKARTRIRELTPEIALIELEVDSGLEVVELRLDSEIRGLGDFPLRVLPGPHKIEAVDVEGATTIEVVDLLPGERIRVRLEPRPKPQPAASVAPPPEQTEPETPERPTGPTPLDPRYVQRIERVRLAGWSMLGVTGVSAISWAVLGGLTLDAKNEFEVAQSQCGISCVGEDVGYPADEEQRFFARRDATNALVGVTGAIGVTAAALLIAGYTGKAKRVPKERRGRRSATVSASSGGLRVRF